jgi:hypothetical protein
MTDTQKAKNETMQEIADKIRNAPEERTPELRALIMGFIAGVQSASGTTQEAN